jgi:flagellar motor switch/type III secretory pathway protein FliN
MIASTGQGAPLPGSIGDAELSAMEGHAAWPMLARVPAVLSVAVPLRGFTVKKLLGLQSGQTVPSTWATTEDVPLAAGEIRLATGEFEIANQHLAIRITSLA